MELVYRLRTIESEDWTLSYITNKLHSGDHYAHSSENLNEAKYYYENFIFKFIWRKSQSIISFTELLYLRSNKM